MVDYRLRYHLELDGFVAYSKSSESFSPLSKNVSKLESSIEMFILGHFSGVLNEEKKKTQIALTKQHIL